MRWVNVPAVPGIFTGASYWANDDGSRALMPGERIVTREEFRAACQPLIGPGERWLPASAGSGKKSVLPELLLSRVDVQREPVAFALRVFLRSVNEDL